MAKKKKRPQAPRPVAPADADAGLSADERAARRAQQKEEWAQQKRAEEKAASRSFAPLFWAGGVIVVLAILIPVVLLVTGGGGADSSSPTPIVTQDPRLGGASPTKTLTIATNDNGQNIASRFEPATLTATAGEVFEIDITNKGSVHHNMTLDGGDGLSNEDDNWVSTPFSFDAGETAKLVAKINQPGAYSFECVLHAGVQVGTITVIPGTSGSATATPAASAGPSPSPTPSP